MSAYICYDARVKRTTIFLPDDLHEKLRREAFHSKISMAELIRHRLRGSGRVRAKQPTVDPLSELEGMIHDGTLTKNLDEELYG